MQKVKAERWILYMNFEVVNELTLKIHMGAGETVFTKAGAFIGGESMGSKNYKFEKILLGVEGNPLSAAMHQLARRFTGENLPLMKVSSNGENITYYANDEQHITVLRLQPGETLSVESENLLAFNQDCKYGVRFIAQGVISQKGLATSTLTGTGPNAMAAILSDGNPVVLSNISNGSTLTADPDAIVAWIGADPSLMLDVSWKNLIGQASGESYMFEWNSPSIIIIQPHERQSGLDISMDGRRTGRQASRQQNQLLGGALNETGNVLSQAGSMLGGNPSNVNARQRNGRSTIGNLFR